MSHRPLVLAILLVFSASLTLTGCDPASRLTDQEHIQRAKDFEDKGDLKSSILELKNAVQKNPDNAQARLLLGQAYLKANLGAEAEKELLKAEKLGVSRESIKTSLAQALLLMGEYPRVLAEVTPSEGLDPRNRALIHSYRGFAHLALHKKDEAEAEFTAADKATPNLPETLLGRARIAMAQLDATKATELVNSALKAKPGYTEAWLFKAALLEFQDKLDDALAAAIKASESNPNHLGARIRLISYYFAREDVNNARLQINAASAISPNNLMVVYYRALLAFSEGKFQEASDILTAILNASSNHVPSLILSGSANFQQGKYEQARQYYARAVGLAPQSLRARTLLAKALIKLGDSKQALETLKPLNPDGTQDVSVLAVAGEAAHSVGDYVLATQYLESSVKLAPDNAALRTELALSRAKSGNLSEALKELEKAAESDSEYFKADVLLALAHIKRGELEAALAAIARLEKKLPNSVLPMNLRAGAYLSKSDNVNARRSLEQALAIQPANFFATLNLARLDLKEGQPDVARKRFESLLKHDKNNVDAMIALGDLAANQKNNEEAVSWFERAVKGRSNAIAPRSKLAYHHLKTGAAGKALAVAKSAYEEHRDNPEAITLLGNVYLATGDKRNALAMYRELVKKLPDSFDAHYKLALMQMESGQHVQARESLAKVLQINPEFVLAQDALIRLNLAERKVEEALKVARDIQRRFPRSHVGFDREGMIHTANKQYAPAANAYSRALELGAGSRGLIKLHVAYRRAGQGNLAAEALAAWMKNHPDDPVVSEYAAEYFMNSGRNKESIALYERLLRKEPSNIKILNNLANLYQREKDKRALATAERAYRSAPEHPVIQDTLGWILIEEGQAQRGVDLLQKAIVAAPRVSVFRYHYAVGLLRINRKAEAKKALQEVIASGQDIPEVEEARRLLSSLN